MRSVVVTIVALLAAGCVLFVKPEDIGDHCATAGSGACADCLRRVCQDKIDTCCGVSACRTSTILGEIDACGNGNGGTCANALATSRIGKDEEALRSCALQCKPLCTNGATADGGVAQKWSCTTARDPSNDCASCIYTSCSEGLDACCSDSSCKSDSTIATDLGACTSGDSAGCAYAVKARSTSGQAGVVRACIENKCASKCLGDNIPHQSCTLLSGGTYCSCTDAEESSGDQCSIASLGGGNCVIGLKGCQCGHYTCGTSSTTEGCRCAFNGGDGLDETCTMPSDADRNAKCCLKLDAYSGSVECFCDKYNTSCDSNLLNEYEIPNCNRDTAFAALSARMIDRCSR